MFAEGALPDGVKDLGLIETLLWTRKDGYFLREGHLSRMKASAAAFSFAFAAADFDRALEEACAAAKIEPLRVRLVLQSNGEIVASAAPFEREPESKIWRVALAETRFDSRDPLLRHKITRRALYEDALARAGADEVIFLNERDEVCEGARTNVFVLREGLLLTPPVSSGLLPGVLRADLLGQGRAKETVLELDDLRGGFSLGNSLRGLFAARVFE